MTLPAGEALPTRPRWSLRIRLIALVVFVALLALTVLDLVLPRIVRSALLESRDQSLTSVVDSAGSVSQASLARASVNSPLKSGVGVTFINLGGVGKLIASPANGDTGPVLPRPLPDAPTTVGGIDPRENYRIVSRTLIDEERNVVGWVVVWSNLDDIDGPLDKLLFAELLVTVGLLILLGGAASLLIRRELKPLEKMADAADSIAAGDLDRRVAVGESGVEVDRLGVAFNGMLDGIKSLLADREAAEQRLRQFVADASHELRTPVAAVRGYSDLYAAGAIPEAPAVGRAMERMGFEARRMGSLVEDLLTLVQADAPNSLVMARVEIVELLAGAVEDAGAIDRSRSWRMVPPPEELPPVVVTGDHNRLHQLFANLLGNIRTHTEPGTTATVSVEPDPDPRFVVVTVADDGRGVDEAALPYLFDRFYRADPSRSREHGGSGLGLAIVAAIASAHGGAVSAARSAAGGLAVRVRLPQAAPVGRGPATVAGR